MTDRRAERDRKRRERRKAREEAERRLEELREAWRRRRADEEEGKKRRCDFNILQHSRPDRLLLERLGGNIGGCETSRHRVGRLQVGTSSRHRVGGFPFKPSLTDCSKVSGEDEEIAEMGDNAGANKTLQSVCSREDEVAWT